MKGLEVTQILPWEIGDVHALRYLTMDQPLGITDQARLAELDTDPDSLLMGGFIGRTIVSTVRLDDIGNGLFRVRRMATHPDHQRLGYGRRTLIAAEHYARTWRSAEAFSLYARREAIPFYESLGYQTAGTFELHEGQWNLEMAKQC